MSEIERIPLSDIIPEDVYRPDQVAKTLRVKTDFVLKAARKGELKAAFLGPRTARIKGWAVLEWCKDHFNTSSEGSEPPPPISQKDNGALLGSKVRSAADIAWRSA